MSSERSYFRCQWLHDSPDEPVLLYEELDANRMETRVVNEFRDGTLERSDRIAPEFRTSLSYAPVPALADIAGQADFVVLPLTPHEFEAVWQRASDAARPD